MTDKEQVEFEIKVEKKGDDLLFLFFLTLTLTLTLTCLSYAQEQQPQPQEQKQQKSLEEERLSIIKSDIQKEIEYIEKLKKEIEDARKIIDENTQERLQKVSKIYEAMPAEEAARRLEKLDEDTAVDILSVLKPRSAGGIMAQMDNAKAASISKKMITRSKPAK